MIQVHEITPFPPSPPPPWLPASGNVMKINIMAVRTVTVMDKIIRNNYDPPAKLIVWSLRKSASLLF